MKIEQLSLANETLRRRYDELFEGCPNAFIQQSTWWAEAIKDVGPDEPVFLLAHDGQREVAGLPLYLYRQPGGNVLTSVPQPGPLGGVFARDDLSEPARELAYAELLARAETLARENDCLSLTLITNPFANDIARYERILKPTYIFENFTQYIELISADTDQTAMLDTTKQRNNLKRNLKKSELIEVYRSGDLNEFEAWYSSCHQARHDKIGARPLAKSLLLNIFKTLSKEGKASFFIGRFGSEIASGCLYVFHKNIFDVFILSMNPRFDRYAPNYKITAESLQYARQSGAKIYNWQSAPSRESGVYKSKKQWGSKDLPYYFVTKLLCDTKVISDIGLPAIKEKYPFHYVVPFAAFSEGFDKQRFAKCPPMAGKEPL